MNPKKEYKSVNRSLWNQWTKDHLTSDFYNMQAFREGKDSLNSIELNLLGDVAGKRILHLQCHFGQDTLSLARRGASVIGVDLSDEAVNTANKLAQELELDGHFIQSDILDLDKVLNEKFDIVFTSYGTIGWLPDLNKWGQIVQQFLKPNGEFIMADFHPVVWMFDDDLQQVTFNYFQDEAIIENLNQSYAENSNHEQLKCISWNHALSEVITVLRNENLQLDVLQEFDYSPYNCFKNTVEVEPNKFRVKHFKNHLPMVYAMRWKK